MKQLKSRALLLTLAAIFFAATNTDSFCQLTKIWEIKPDPGNLSSISPMGKLAHVGAYLVDLNDGKIIETKYLPETYILTYTGKRYFITNRQTKTMKVYDRYTKEFIQDLEYNYIWEGSITAPDDSTIFEFERNSHSLQFKNIYTNELLESYKIPNTPDQWTYDVGVHPSFSYDGRYFGFTFKAKSGATGYNYMVYDRVARQIVFFKTLPISQYSFVHSFMHTKNELAFGEVVKLEGDDKPYSYIRIFDLDKREVVRNVRVGDEENGVAVLTIKTDDNYAIWILFKDNNYQYFYDIQNDKISDFKINTIGSILLTYDNFLVTYGMKGYTFDWAVGVDDTNPIEEDLIIYPNPTTNSVNLNVEEKYFNGHWQIIDTRGKVVLQGIIPASPNLQINVNNLTPQPYNLILQKSNFISTYKLIKM